MRNALHPHISSHAEVFSMLADNRLFLKFLLHFPAVSVFAVLQSTLDPLLFTEASPTKHLLCSLNHLAHRKQVTGKTCQNWPPCHKSVPYWSLDLEQDLKQVGNFQINFSLENMEPSEPVSLLGKWKLQWIFQLWEISIRNCWYLQ